jgi:hypothetical protein
MDALSTKRIVVIADEKDVVDLARTWLTRLRY